MPQKRLSHDDYTVGWVCPLEVEQIAAMEMLDEEHEPLPQLSSDTNIYNLGGINNHNIVIAGLPVTGNCSAATVIAQMKMTFRGLKYCLLVGIGGGVPVKTDDGLIRLGHVVVSKPTGVHSGAVQYHHGKARAGEFQRQGSLAPPPTVLLNAAREVAVRRRRMENDPIWENTQRIETSRPMLRRFKFPGALHDHLYLPDYEHQQDGVPCAEGGCDLTKRVERPTEDQNECFIVVHRGTIASGELVIKDAKKRDDLAREHGVLCFEMEAAGALADFPCMIIRGISDYCDSHKNDVWHGYAAATAAAYARQLFCHMPVEHARERLETPQNPSIVIPFERDRDFVRRGRLLDQIENSCSRAGSRIALVGLGGVGKSQLAIEFAYRTRERSPTTWVLWIHASNAARFEQSFRDIAMRIQIPGWQNPKANIFQLVHDWLQVGRKESWVIVLDNVDDATFLKSPDHNAKSAAPTTESVTSRQLISYIPRCQHGSVLITSRSRGAALELVENADIVAIEPMNEEDALRLFANKLGPSNNEAFTAELAAALEYMPLAIVQAAAYILQRRPRCSVQKYLNEFRKSDRKKAGLLNNKGGELRRDTEAKNSILITWQISFNYIHEIRPSAAGLLSLMSFCDRQGIPEFLLRNQNHRPYGSGEQNSRDRTNSIGEEEDHHNTIGDDASLNSDSDSDLTEVRSDCSDSDQFENDIVTLRNFFFIIANDDGTTFEMHRLIQLATLEWLKAHDMYEQLRHRFLVRLCAELPTGEYENWAKCQLLFPHAQSVATRCPEAGESIVEWSAILHKAAWYALRIGRGVEAENLSLKALTARQKILDAEHEDVLDSLAMVSLVCNLRGQWNEAEMLQVQVMKTRKKNLGEDHPDTLTSMANLALIFCNQGQWTAAEELEAQVVEARKKKLGEDHPDTLISMNNLATTYKRQGRREAAEELFVHVMERGKKKLREGHPFTLTSMANLALSFRDQGRWTAAEELEIEVMETRKRKLGEDHPDTLRSVTNLASTFRHQGKREAAEELEVQVKEAYKKKRGENHSDTLTSMSNLAGAYSKQGRWEAAEEPQVRVVKTRKRKLGEDRPDTLSTMVNLASTFCHQGRREAAEELFMQVVDRSKTELGEDHPSTLTSMANLAMIYKNSSRWEAAEELEVQVMEYRKRKLGEEHPDTLTSMANLAATYRNQGRWEATEKLEVQVIETREKNLGENHLSTLTSIANLASTFWLQGRKDAADKLFMQVMERSKKNLGSDHPDTLNSIANLA